RVRKPLPEIGRYITEGRDAQTLCHQLKLRVTVDRLSHRFRQAYIVCNHFAIACRSDLLQRKPHLQSAEPTRVLRSILDVVRGALREMIMGRGVRKGGAERCGVANKSAPGSEGSVKLFVRTPGDRARPAQPE